MVDISDDYSKCPENLMKFVNIIATPVNNKYFIIYQKF